MNRSRRLLAAGLTMGLCGCGPENLQAPVCTADIPAASALLADPALQPLKYFVHTNYDFARGVGYDVWGDAKFEYRAALQYTVVPSGPSIRNAPQYCARSLALRLAWPLDEQRTRMLSAFLKDVARHSRAVPADLETRIAAVVAEGAPYRTLSRQERFALEAGRVAHPTRGDFLVVGLEWAYP